MFNRVFKTLLFVTMMVGCTSFRMPATQDQAAFDRELSNISGGGVKWGIRQTRYSLKLPRLKMDSGREKGLLAYIVGPRSLLGELKVIGASIKRVSVYDLKALFGSDVDGVLISGVVLARSWPEAFVLNYGVGQDEFSVKLEKFDDGYSESALFYQNFPNRFKIAKRRQPIVKVFVSVNKPVAGKKLVCYEDNEFGTFYYYLNK